MSKYIAHTIKNTDGNHIIGRVEVGLITQMVCSGQDDCMVKGTKVSVFSDEIKDGERFTVVKVHDGEDPVEQ